MYPMNLGQLVAPGIVGYSSQADYLKKEGKSAPTYNPARPVQMWRDSNPAPSGNSPWKGSAYNIVVRENVPENGVIVFGVAVLETWSVPAYIADTPNIPPDQGNWVSLNPNQAPYALEQVPIRALLPGESLASSPWGVWIDGPNPSE